MFFNNLLLTFITVISSQNLNHPTPRCDFLIQVPSRQKVIVTNPGWPLPYPANSVCRWIFECPTGTVCRLRCRDIGLPETDGCFLDKLLISTEGSLDLRDALTFCGGRKLSIKSFGPRLVMGLVSGVDSPGGRFRCKVRAEP